MTLIQTFSDGSILTFDDGAFDRWCVYLQRPSQPRHAPTDIQYFAKLQQLGDRYGHQKIYDDFVAIYEPTTACINRQVLNQIRQVSKTYHNDGLEVEILFAVVYAGMVAEENKQNAILKKRIKRLGMYQILVDKVSPHIAANFSRGKQWRELDQICRINGF